MAEWNGAVVIVGSGAAGHSCARTLRASGFGGRITMIDAEDGGVAINRPLVDIGVLPGLLTAEQIALPPVPGIEAVTARATRLGEDDRSVMLEDGREVRGDAIVLACGSVPRRLGADVLPDPDLPLHHIYGVGDADRLRRAVPDPATARVVVIGAGFIGSEVASYYAGVGARVTLVGRSPLGLADALGSGIAQRLAALQREHVETRFGAGVRSVRRVTGEERAKLGAADVVRVELDDGGPALFGDAVIVAIGSMPAAEWAGHSAAIPTDSGLRVAGRTRVYAAGSVAAPETRFGALRVDHWEAAVAQGAHAARVLLHDVGGGEDPGPYQPVTGFTLMVHGAAIAALGVRSVGARDENVEVAGGGVVTEFAVEPLGLSGVAGWNAGPHLARAASRLGRE